MARQTEFLLEWTDEIGTLSDGSSPQFLGKCEALLAAAPAAISSMMGIYPPEFVSRMEGPRDCLVCNGHYAG